MTKADFWEKIWIPVKKRKPPESDDLVIMWHPMDKVFSIQTAAVARYSAMAFEDGREIAPDRIFSDWCFLHSPKKRSKV